MTRKKSGLVLLILSMVYAAVIALLAVADSSLLTPVAIAGGALLGIGWATVGYLSNQKA
ncbi:hypothetical protein OG205_23500 [Lentzea sp. NBC_00516]|uniref:hypothetical protein n=1 Tax=Lentzea sp. NBC_00516 TaxID=2903582 RepID=UPI002E81ABFC|nr:hypothetical protein [Lentzea sp. NBC_00516]WUD21118.1 hypothetical protein OG205_23500 [Lentzea sp. NBC_00516]